jgi:hypothetical protein
MVPGFSSIEHRRRISVRKVTLETVKSIKYKNKGKPSFLSGFLKG